MTGRIAMKTIIIIIIVILKVKMDFYVLITVESYNVFKRQLFVVWGTEPNRSGSFAIDTNAIDDIGFF